MLWYQHGQLRRSAVSQPVGCVGLVLHVCLDGMYVTGLFDLVLHACLDGMYVTGLVEWLALFVAHGMLWYQHGNSCCVNWNVLQCK